MSNTLIHSGVVPAKAGTQYPRAWFVMLERAGPIGGYWVPAIAGTTQEW
jgi:hypothetical protein